jgi:cysteinyl-tRNA synthetase
MEVTPDTIGDAEKGLDRIDEFARRFPRDGAAPDADAVDRFRAAMEDDLNTPAAVALLFDLVRKANSDQDSAAVAAAYVVLDALGLDVRQGDDEVDEATAALVAARDEARRTRDFAAADRIRDELQALGWVVKDTAEGTQVHR